MTSRTSPDRGGFSRFVPTSSWGRLLVVTAVLAVAAAAVVMVLGGRNATSAAQGREGTRTFEGTPDELPETAVPDDAVEVEGTVKRNGEDWSAAVTYVVEGVQRETVIPTVDEALTADGCRLRQRSYDATTMQVVYDCTDGSVATVTYRHVDEGTGTAIVLVGP